MRGAAPGIPLVDADLLPNQRDRSVTGVFAFPVVSIRWKLFLSLFLLTAGSSALVLWLAEHEFRGSVREQVGASFDNQIRGLLEARGERLGRVRELCTRLAADEWVRRQLREDAIAPAGRDFISRFEELRESLDAGERARPGSGDPGLNPARELPIMGVVTLGGEIRTLTRVPDGLRRRRRPPQQLQELARQPSQQVAYAVVETETENSERQAKRVQEVVVTPVRDDAGAMLGWFFLGRNAETRDQQIFQRAETLSGREARTGLVVEDEWFVPGLSDSDRQTLSVTRGGPAWTGDDPKLVELDGGPFLLATAPLNPESPLGRGYQVTLFPVGSLIDAIQELRWKVAGLGLIAVVSASFVALWLSARFNRPIAALVAGTERVRRGEFDRQVPVRSKDELGHLAGAFNRMTRDLALKERYHEVLGKVSDPAVARRLMEGELELGGELVEAAVLFCDIRGFTALTDGMPPGEVIDLLNEHMTALTGVVHAHGGVVDKFVGDLVMALFGVPRSHGDDALRAARCALAMLGERRALDARSGRTVEVGIGVAHGPLVAGCMGSTDRLNYTVLGDRVNLASRLCSAAGAGEILVDDGVARAASPECGVIRRAPMPLKGFATPVAAFSLRDLGQLGQASREPA